MKSKKIQNSALNFPKKKMALRTLDGNLRQNGPNSSPHLISLAMINDNSIGPRRYSQLKTTKNPNAPSLLESIDGASRNGVNVRSPMEAPKSIIKPSNSQSVLFQAQQLYKSTH